MPTKIQNSRLFISSKKNEVEIKNEKFELKDLVKADFETKKVNDLRIFGTL